MDTVLRYETEASDIYYKLRAIPRTGWVMLDVENPETVYDHTVSLVQLAADMQTALGLTDTELDDLQHMLEVHDWAEAVAGDEFIPNEDKRKAQSLKVKKAEREQAGLKQLLAQKPYADTVQTLFDRYETGSDPIAKLAKELDKYQALELALHYEQEQGIALFTEFYEYYKREWPFSHPAILTRIAILHATHQHHTATKE